MKRVYILVIVYALAAAVMSCSPRGDGEATYVPSFCPDYVAQDLEVAPGTGNVAPRAYYQSLVTTEDTPLSITLYACDPNDVDTSDGLTWTVDSGPLSGTLSTYSGAYPDAVISYTPGSGYTGTDSFTFHVNDSLLDGNVAEILITVNPAATAGSTWIRTYLLPNETMARDIKPITPDGFYLAGTNFKASGTQVDFWAIRADGQGVVQWETTAGGGISDIAFGSAPTSDGGLILVGQTQSFGQGSADIWVVKLDSAGAVTWERAFGTTIQDYSYSVDETMNATGAPDGYVVSGYRGTTVNDTADIVVLRLATDGTLVWQRAYDGGLNDIALSTTTRQTGDLGFIVAAMTASFTGIDYDAWLLKLNVDGTINWQRTIGVSSPAYPNERVRSVRETSDGGFILGGMTEQYDSNGDYWVVKTDAAGNVNWQRSYGGTGTDEVYAVEQTPDGGYLVMGNSSSFNLNDDAWILKLDSGGAVQWQVLYDAGDNDLAEAGYQLAGGGYLITGSTASFSGGSMEAWVLRLDANGQMDVTCGYGTSPAYATSITTAVASGTDINPITLNLVAEDTNATVSTATGTVTTICGDD